MYLGKCSGGCALAAEGKHSTVPARRGRDRERTVRSERAGERARERQREREREREGGRGEERGRAREPGRRASSRGNSAPARPAPAPSGQPPSRASCHWSWLCIKDPLYAHTHLHLHQCTLLPPPADLYWEKNKTPTPTVSSKVTEKLDLVFLLFNFFPCYICLLISTQKERCRIRL